uniref:Uncharacterized protein n=1 Tax=Auxenochlorella protothecoides TaxID=3075 RepID=A0A1D2A2L8_AUXPR
MLQASRISRALRFRTEQAIRAFATSNESGALEAEGVKKILQRHLGQADRPLTSAELWSLTEPEGVKSKRHMKQMLQQMRKTQVVATKPLGASTTKKSSKQFGYLLAGSAATPKPVATPASA